MKKLILVMSSRSTSANLTIGNVTIKTAKEVRYLVVLFDSCLIFQERTVK